MAKYRIIESRSSMVAQVWRWWCPFWTTLKGYSKLYLDDPKKVLRWCNEAIENHKAGRPLEEPEWTVVDTSPGDKSK